MKYSDREESKYSWGEMRSPMTFFKSSVERDSNRWKLQYSFFNLAVFVAVYFSLLGAMQQFKIPILLFSVAAIVLAYLARGEKIIDDLVVFFVSLFGVVPVFGWIALPDMINPVIAVITFWIVKCFTRPSRNVKQAAISVFAPVAGFFATFIYWKDLSEGDSVSVLSRLFPIWDTSAHFYFFMLNLEYGSYIPRISKPIDGGMNQWSGIEYPTGIHYVWSRFVGTDIDVYVDRPILATPFFASAMVISLAVSVAFVIIAISRVTAEKPFRIHVGVISLGISMATVGLGIFSQTITSGFVNTSTVVAMSALLLSHLLRPHLSLRLNDFIVVSCVLGISYNWYPVLLFFFPSLTAYLFTRLRQQNMTNRFIIMAAWGAGATFAMLPIIQSLSLGVSHLSENGGVGRLSPNLSMMVFLLSMFILIVSWSYLTVQDRLLLVTPGLINLIFAVYFRLTDGDYRYYFQKISMFSVILNIFVIAALTFVYFTNRMPTPEGGKQFRSFTLSVIAALMIFQLFGYFGPDAKRFAADGALWGLNQRDQKLQKTEQNLRTARIINAAAEQVMDLPLRDKSWLMLALPNRITKTSGYDGSHIILSNVWLHSLTKSQTLTGNQTSYVAVNLEARGALASDKTIADEMPKIFQPDSVLVYSTSDVVNRLKNDGYPWKTIVFDEAKLQAPSSSNR